MQNANTSQEPVVGLDFKTTTLDEVHDSLSEQVMSEGDNLRIICVNKKILKKTISSIFESKINLISDLLPNLPNDMIYCVSELLEDKELLISSTSLNSSNFDNYVNELMKKSILETNLDYIYLVCPIQNIINTQWMFFRPICDLLSQTDDDEKERVNQDVEEWIIQILLNRTKIGFDIEDFNRQKLEEVTGCFPKDYIPDHLLETTISKILNGVELVFHKELEEYYDYLFELDRD